MYWNLFVFQIQLDQQVIIRFDQVNLQVQVTVADSCPYQTSSSAVILISADNSYCYNHDKGDNTGGENRASNNRAILLLEWKQLEINILFEILFYKIWKFNLQPASHILLKMGFNE